MNTLEVMKAYAEYKMRNTGDLDTDLVNWVYNINRFIAIKKRKK